MKPQQVDFVNEVYQTARSMGLPDAQARLAASQAALETGYGRSVKGNNYFGIKAGSSWDGPVQNFKTWEEVNGRRKNITDAFRAYDSKEESLQDWINLVTDRWPGAMEAPTFKEAAKGLRYGQRGGYATDSQYGNKLSYVNRRIDGAFAPEPEALGEFARQTENNAGLLSLLAGDDGVPSAPSIFDGFNIVADTNLTATPTPTSKPDNPANPSFADNAVGPLSESVSPIGGQVPRNVSDFFTGAPQDVRDRVAPMLGQDTPTTVGGNVPASRFDQAFSAFDNAPAVAANQSTGYVTPEQLGLRTDSAPGVSFQEMPDGLTQIGSSPVRGPMTVDENNLFSVANETLGFQRGGPGPAPTIAQGMDIVANLPTTPGVSIYNPAPNMDVTVQPEALPALDAPQAIASAPVASVTDDDEKKKEKSFMQQAAPYVGAALGTALTGNPLIGAAAGAYLGKRGMPNIFGGMFDNVSMPQSMGPLFSPEGFAETARGQAYNSAMNGGDFWSEYARAGGASDAGSFARAQAEEQRARSQQGQQTVGDAFGGLFSGLFGGRDDGSGSGRV